MACYGQESYLSPVHRSCGEVRHRSPGWRNVLWPATMVRGPYGTLRLYRLPKLVTRFIELRP